MFVGYKFLHTQGEQIQGRLKILNLNRYELITSKE